MSSRFMPLVRGTTACWMRPRLSSHHGDSTGKRRLHQSAYLPRRLEFLCGPSPSRMVLHILQSNQGSLTPQFSWHVERTETKRGNCQEIEKRDCDDGEHPPGNPPRTVGILA